MQFEVTEDFLDKVSVAINENNIKWLEKQLKKLHSADIAEILNELNLEDGKKLYNSGRKFHPRSRRLVLTTHFVRPCPYDDSLTFQPAPFLKRWRSRCCQVCVGEWGRA